MVRIPPPIYTLRHRTGFTAIYSYRGPNSPLIVSGDEEGNIYFWCSILFKSESRLEKAVPSRIQSINVIFLNFKPRRGRGHRGEGRREEDLLVLQTRDDGVYLLDFEEAFYEEEARVMQHYPIHPSLFCRGAAASIEGHRAILAFPSETEGHTITVRMLGDDVKPIATAEAKRPNNKRNLFDIIFRRFEDEYSIYAAYEDGCVCHYSLDIDLKDLKQENNRLEVKLLRTIDTGIKDFVSAIDVNSRYLVAGTPKKELIFSEDLTDEGQVLDRIPLKKHGVSALSIRPDEKYVAVAGWDNSVRLYSMRTQQLMGSMNVHSKPVQEILFIRKASHPGTNDLPRGKYMMLCASLDGTISVSMIM